MTRQQTVIERAYSNIPREVGIAVDWDILGWRGLRYYWLCAIRKVKGR